MQIKEAELSELFQFHYGTIKSQGNEWDMYLETNFNSTMVRLKARSGSRCKLRFVKFQFHYGTIKSSLL